MNKQIIAAGLLCVLALNVQAELFLETALGTAADAAGFITADSGFSWESPDAGAARLGLFGNIGLGYADTAAGQSFSAGGGAEWSAFVGPLVPFGRLFAAVDGDAEDGTRYQGGLDLSLTANGAATSLFADGGGTLSGGAENAGELYARFGFSRLFGSLVLKPGLGVEAAWLDDAFSSWAVLPALAASWYPGFPLSAALSAGFRRTIDAAAEPTDSFPWTLELSGEPTDRFGFSIFSAAEHTAEAVAGQAALELTFNLPPAGPATSWLFLAGTLDYDSAETEPLAGWELRSGLTILF